MFLGNQTLPLLLLMHSLLTEPTKVYMPFPLSAKVHRLRAVLSGLLEKFDKSPSVSVPKEDCADFSGFLAVTDSEVEDGEVPESVPDSLEELDALGCSQPSQFADVGGDDAMFLRALEELKDHFHGQEEKGEPLFDRLAAILDASLRRRPTSEGVKLSCNKIKLPSNVPDLTVPTTNSAIAKAIARVLGKNSKKTRLLCLQFCHFGQPKRGSREPFSY